MLFSFTYFSQEKRDSLIIHLFWEKKNLKYVSGKVSLKEENTNFFYGIYLPYKEYSDEIYLTIPIDSIIKKDYSTYKLKIYLNEFYQEEIDIQISGSLNSFSIKLKEIPECELEKINIKKRKK